MSNGSNLATVVAEAAEGASKPATPAATESGRQTEGGPATPAPGKENQSATSPAATTPAAGEASEKPDLDTIRREAAQAERTRIAALDKIALPGCEEIVEAAKANGGTPEQAALEMVKHLKTTGQLDISKQMATAAATVPPLEDALHDPVQAGAGAPPKAGTEEAWRAEFAASDQLRAEFAGNADAYVAYKRNAAAGRARIRGHKED